MVNNSSALTGQNRSTSGNEKFSEGILRMSFYGAEVEKSSQLRNIPDAHNANSQDDGCRLVLGLGPTPNYYRGDCSPAEPFRSKDHPVLFHQAYGFSDHGMLSLALQGECSEPAQAAEASRQRVLSFAACDEGSTSAKRNAGGYMPSLLFAPRSNFPSSNREQAETLELLDFGSNSATPIHRSQEQVPSSPEPSATAEHSLGCASSDMLSGATGSERRNMPRHPKKCMFRGCNKGARGASGLCIAHGGGQRCQKPGCNKGAESKTAYCKAHGGGRRCEQLGCTKSAEGKTDFCIAHGGGRRCGRADCRKAARGKSGLCIKHGGGKRCTVEGCVRSAEGKAGLCISHGGGRRCQYPDCNKGAQGCTLYCKSHGGGKRCIFEGCTKGAEGSTPLCKAHGGGKRCLHEGGGVCPKSVHGGTNYCVAHGGGKRCSVPGCSKSARGRTDCCVKHGGGKRCRIDGCGKSAQGSTDFCKAHGGGKRCTWDTGCEKFARGKSGLCAAHGSLMASYSQQENGSVRGGSMIGPDLFHGVVGGGSDHSSSGTSTLSECGGSPAGSSRARSQTLIPQQVLVPPSMKLGSSSSMPSSSGAGSFVVPEGRVHGGGLMSLFGGDLSTALNI